MRKRYIMYDNGTKIIFTKYNFDIFEQLNKNGEIVIVLEEDELQVAINDLSKSNKDYEIK